ncbi:hypothetical protein QYE76_049023 [Lolium multiflorum]|uniref:F-box domain-containing protein n=1 Tax=Lolium multiflorum TaxID=4521 RepID=A0AAD8WFY3_LOLMU|nr:hypothetical protein QYE76_049023 [Lolium multiflorum]
MEEAAGAAAPTPKRRGAGRGMSRKRARHDNHGDLIKEDLREVAATGAPPPAGGTGAAAEEEKEQSPDKATATPRPRPRRARGRRRPATTTAPRSPPLFSATLSADEIEEDARPRRRPRRPSAGTPVEKRGRAGSGMPRKRARHDNHGDLISGLPDDILATIISLLPTRNGANTQLVARSWRPLWRLAPLNICSNRLCSNQYNRISVVTKLLTIHHGPKRRLDLDTIRFHTDKKIFADETTQLEEWFSSGALAKLEELNMVFEDKGYQLPSSVLLCAPALEVARFSFCNFPKEVTHFTFPLLKKLSLRCVEIAGDAFHGLLSGCPVLESLYLERLNKKGIFRISSKTLRSVGLCNCFLKEGELIIENAPRLERLLLPRPGSDAYILRVISAPKLKILGLLSPCISELQIANIIFKSLAPTSLENTMRTLKILALEFSVADLDATIGVLRCFPCIEKLYVNFMKWLDIPVSEHVHPTDPVKCPDLKELVLNNYKGSEQDVCFAKFFLSNSPVLKKIRLGVIEKIKLETVSKEWMDHQYRLLEVGTSDQVEFVASEVGANFFKLDVFDLSTADPFASSYSQME